jgi:hypothetical protein
MESTRERISKKSSLGLRFDQEFANTGGKTLQLDRDEFGRRLIDSESIRDGVPPPLGDRNVISTAR